MQRQTSLVYKVSFRSVRATKRNPVLKGKKKGKKKRKTKDTDYWHKQNVIFSTHLFGIFTEYLDCSSSCSEQHTGLLVRWHSLFSGDCEPQYMSPQRFESKICEHNRFCMESFRYKIWEPNLAVICMSAEYCIWFPQSIPFLFVQSGNSWRTFKCSGLCCIEHFCVKLSD